MQRILFGVLLASLAALIAPASANDSVLECIQNKGNWCMQQHDYSATRYSDLDQINTTNVGTLKVACTF